MDDVLEFGGNIVLCGFSDIDKATMVIVKKIVGNYAKKFSESLTGFEKVKVTVKTVHKREKSEKYEVHVNLMVNGETKASEVIDMNLFFALDTALKKASSL